MKKEKYTNQQLRNLIKASTFVNMFWSSVSILIVLIGMMFKQMLPVLFVAMFLAGGYLVYLLRQLERNPVGGDK